MGRLWLRTVASPSALLPLALAALACSSVIGIEEVHEGAAPNENNAGEGGTGGSSGGSGGSGGESTSATGGSGGDAGSSGSGGDAGSGGSGGDAGPGGSGGSAGSGGSGGDAGSGGSGGSAGSGGSGGNAGSGGSGGSGPLDTTVRGQVVNHWLQPVPNVQVMIGDELELTDDNGEFEIADVDASYDLMMVVRYQRYGNDGPLYGWVYEGLTRRDPTLQVYGGLPLVSGNLEYTPTNVANADERVLLTALGGEYGDWERNGTNAVITSSSWFGPDSVTVNAHGLLLTETDDLPSAYHAYDFLSGIVFPETTDPAIFSLDMSDEAIASGQITGTVTSPTTSDRENHVYVRFPDNAPLHVVDHYGSDLVPDYSYLVPELPDATITVSASEGFAFFGAAAVAFETGVEIGDDIDLTIPAPPVLNAPPSNTTLDENTTFSWAGSSDTYIWHMESSNWYEGIYVVTTRSQIEMPVFPNGFALRPDEPHYWRVETHGSAQSVDELAGPDGFASEFSYTQGDGLTGPQRTSGTFSISLSRGVTTAP